MAEDWQAGDVIRTAHGRFRRLVSGADFRKVVARLSARDKVFDTEVRATVHRLRFALQEDADSGEPCWQETEFRRGRKAREAADRLRAMGAKVEDPEAVEVKLEVVSVG
jgi:hypothetical protein